MKKISLFIFSLFSILTMSACNVDDEERDIDPDEPGITDPEYGDDENNFEMPDEDDFRLPDDELEDRTGINDEEEEEVDPEETVE